MRLELTDRSVGFFAGTHLAGRYVLDDPFKPYLHPLNTPSGHTVSLAMPHDHRHHKGVMYGLRGSDVNFWEEVPASPGDRPGIQRHDRFTEVTEAGETVGFAEELTWLEPGSGRVVFRESRRISCTADLQRQGYEWHWTTGLEAQVDIDLIMSQWSAKALDGTLVNYHGLGARLRRDFGCTGGNGLMLDGVETSFDHGMGKIASRADFRGSIDGLWPPPQAGIALSQDGDNALFVLDTPFAFVGMGPTNLEPRHLRHGERIDERYRITVFDVSEQHASAQAIQVHSA